jgi:hypothetical protein
MRGLRIRLTRVSIASSVWSIAPKTYRLPYIATTAGSVTVRTYCEAVSCRVYFGPTSMLSAGSGFSVSETPPSPDHDPSGRVS